MTNENSTGKGRNRVDVATLNAWIEQAQPGARLVYYHGDFAAKGSEAVNDRLHAEEARGMLYLVQDHRRVTKDGHDYIAIRSSRPSGEAATRSRPRPGSMADQARLEGEKAFRSSGQ